MQVPLEISYREVEKSEAIEQLIREKVSKLEKICNYLNSCRVAVEQTQRHQKTGSSHRVRINITVPPGHELVVDQKPSEGHIHEDLNKAIRDAFDIARRQLQELVEKQRGETKKHPDQEVTAIVSRLFPEEGYGFIRSTDGREIYLHRNSVANNDFDRLRVGSGVHYQEEPGEKGPQATVVHLLTTPPSE